MTRSRHFATVVAALAICAPLVAIAQTANTPGGQAATGTGLEQDNKNPAATTPGRTRTNPDMTNPKGTLPSNDDDTKGKRGAMNRAKPGDVPTYPAPAPSGEPTK